MSFSRSRMIAQLFFALLLVVAQGHLLIHQTDLDAHAEPSSCEICIHLGHLGQADSAGSLSVANFPAVDDYLVLPGLVNAFASFYALPQSRAPPSSSLI